MADDIATLGFNVDTRGLITGEKGLNSYASTGERTEKRMDKSVSGMNSTFLTLKSTIGLVGIALSGLAIGSIAKDVTAYSDEWKGLNSQLRQVTESEKELLSVRKELFSVSQDTRSELKNTVNLFSEIKRSTDNLGVSTSQQISLVKTLNNLFLAGGKPISEVSGAIRQLTQGFASGVLRGDEFNSVAEGAPRIMDALSESLKMTRGELREFAATGGITAEIMVEALESYSDTAQKMADQTTTTLAQSFQVAENNALKFIGASELVNDATASMGGGIVSLSENLDALADAGEALIGIVAIGLTPAVARYTMALVATTTAQLVAGTTATRTANAFGMVTVTAASATVATNALGVATRFLLGPWGLLITALGTAAAVFATSKTNSEELATSIETQIKVVDDLERAYTSMSNKEIGSAYLSAQKNLIEIDRQRLEIQEKMVKASNQGISGASQFAALSRSLQELNESSKGSESRLEAIQNIFNDGLNSIEWIDPLVEAEKQAKETALANEILAESYAKFLEEVRNYQSPMDSLLSKLEMVNSALAKGDLQPTDGVLGYITLLAEGIANLNEVTQEDNSYQVWLDNITSSSTQSRLESLQDEITNVWLAMDDPESGLSREAGLEYIGKMEDKIKSLQKTLSGNDMFNMIGDSAKDALGQVQGLSEQGSSEYAKLGIAIQAVSAIQAVFAVLNQASGDPYTAFGRMAAMAGAVASLGFSVGSIGGGESTEAVDAQAIQGTTIWGSKSESISNSIEVTADATSKLVGINTGMLNALTSLQTGIANVASMAIRGIGGVNISDSDMGIIDFNKFHFDPMKMLGLGFLGDFVGDFLGGLLSGESNVTNSGIKFGGGLTGDADIMGFQTTEYKKWKFGSTKTREDFYSLGNDINAQFNSVFMDIAGSVAQGAMALGLSESEITKSINDFEIATQKISLKDLSAEEQAAEIEAVFSSIFDDVALATIPFLTQFQKTGEGLGETLARVSTQVQITEVLADQLGVTLGDKLANPQLFAEIADNLSTMVGGLEEFASKTASFIDDFAPESVKFDIAAEGLTNALSEVGLKVPDSATGFWELMNTLDGTTESGQKQIAALLNAQGVAGDYYDFIDDMESDRLSEAAERESELSSFNSMLSSTVSSIKSAISSLFGNTVASQMVAGANLDEAILAARGGDYSKAIAFDASSVGSDSSGFSSASDFAFSQAVTGNKLSQLAGLLDGEKTHEDLMLHESKTQSEELMKQSEQITILSSAMELVAKATDKTAKELQNLRVEPLDVRTV